MKALKSHDFSKGNTDSYALTKIKPSEMDAEVYIDCKFDYSRWINEDGNELTDKTPLDLKEKEFINCSFRETVFDNGMNFSGSIFRGGGFQKAQFKGGNFTKVHFNGIDFTGAFFVGGIFNSAHFLNSNLTGTTFGIPPAAMFNSK